MPKNGISPARPSQSGALGIEMRLERAELSNSIYRVADRNSTGRPRDRFRILSKPADFLAFSGFSERSEPA
jgi:hypothetical protein